MNDEQTVMERRGAKQFSMVCQSLGYALEFDETFQSGAFTNARGKVHVHTQVTMPRN